MTVLSHLLKSNNTTYIQTYVCIINVTYMYSKIHISISNICIYTTKRHITLFYKQFTSSYFFYFRIITFEIRFIFCILLVRLRILLNEGLT